MKLKTVSRLTLLFALACLGAFIAGHPPAAADARIASVATLAQSGAAGGPQRRALRNDDAGRVPLGLRR